jgi:hypothetical protein
MLQLGHDMSTALQRLVRSVAAAGALAVVMVRVLNATSAGIRIIDAVPDGWWERYHRLLGLATTGNVERLQDADALAVAIVCLAPAGALVATAMTLTRRRSRRPAPLFGGG